MDLLARIGFSEAIAQHIPAELQPARVAVDGRPPLGVLTHDGETRAICTGHLRLYDAVPTVGDWVGLGPDTGGPRPIEVVAPRRSALVRRSVGGGSAPQVLAANVDVVLVVEGLDRAFSPRRAERFIAAAWESGATPVLVLAKADVAADPERTRSEAETVLPSVEVLCVSALDDAGLAPVRELLPTGRTGALIGLSGAGKSTLVNRLLGGPAQAVGDVRVGDHRGRHTTTHRRLVLVPDGGAIIDGPGIRELALWDAGEAIDSVFADIAELAHGCRFKDCRHRTEPDCAVLGAIADGRLDDARLASFHKLEREASYARAQTDVLLQQQERNHWRAIHRAQAKLQRLRGR